MARPTNNTKNYKDFNNHFELQVWLDRKWAGICRI